MSRIIGLLGGAALGAVAMYLLDPDKGQQRRAVVKDRAQDYAKNSSKAISGAAHKVMEKASSLTHRAPEQMSDVSMADARIIEMVEAALAKAVRYPKAIKVSSIDGAVTIAGPILSKEVEALMKKIRAIKGVSSVEDQMQVHESADNVDAFHQHTSGSNGNGGSILSHVNGRSLLMSLVGVGLTAYAIKKRGPIGAAASTVGTAIMNKAFHRGHDTEPMVEGFNNMKQTSTSTMIDSSANQVPASAI